jgi:hypothetical protein
MGICFSEPTIDDLLNDSMTQGLMRADGVDASALKTMLYGLASSIESRPAIQHDRMSPNGGVLAWNDSILFQRDSSNNAALPAASLGTPDRCVAC